MKFCQEGACVTIVDADPEALTRTALSIEQAVAGARVAQFAADVADEESALRAVQIAVAQHGGLNILVNNAAMRNFSTLAQASMVEWQSMIQVNLLGVANYSRAALPLLRQHRGCIVNVSSCYAVTGRKGMGLYDATKAAQLSMTRTLAHEEAPHGVRVNAVCPGSTLTDFHTSRAVHAGKSVEALKKERQSTSLLGRWADPQEIAAPILWLASTEASFITGTTLMVDGGLHIM
jgi:meso-butanediol dehydrogenase/(S,S)-butanediol dehydrogenase/diacetyl reductase